MCLVELVTHRNNIVDRKLGGGVGLEHCRVVDVLALAGDCRLYGEELRIDVGHIHSRELYGESANVGGMDTAAVNKAGNLYAGICSLAVGIIASTAFSSLSELMRRTLRIQRRLKVFHDDYNETHPIKRVWKRGRSE